jgi:hypothetical protein
MCLSGGVRAEGTMAVILLVKSGPFDKRVASARHALRSWGYHLVKARAISCTKIRRMHLLSLI